MYKMQRPGIAPELVYVVDWKPKTLALFHNRGVLHSITGAFQVHPYLAVFERAYADFLGFAPPFPSLQPDEVRALYVLGLFPLIQASLTLSMVRSWQNNLASTDVPLGPSDEDVLRYA